MKSTKLKKRKPSMLEQLLAGSIKIAKLQRRVKELELAVAAANERTNNLIKDHPAFIMFGAGNEPSYSWPCRGEGGDPLWFTRGNSQ